MLGIRKTGSRIMAFPKPTLQKAQDGLSEWNDDDDTALGEEYAAQ
jgi:hypothetical protein